MNRKAKTDNPTDYPPANALRVSKWSDMPANTAPARYEIIGEDGQAKTITLAKGNRIILDALLERPVYCASPVRISDRVCILRRDYGVPITKEMYSNDAATDRARFGVYSLNGTVRRIEGGAA
ncbi:hypothetical protein [Roseovarius atlanticus]|uniref:hypothetical protein n=1 Tax=Roseovarius atlanticus TaxID=1641875 RepID=UPI001C93DF3B|nr:hypothetical protein [Roseovarius atlanticus]MBY5987101.1 hypothetical protein [Roseovarius atlanticus]MBY6125741.1 hypothetical protein [Roseovarius atlanticus]MBY6149798.1 hypothetical protein [Roseovarius atlanticus]